MSREELLELIARMTEERMGLIKRAEEAEKRGKIWYELWREKYGETGDVFDKVSEI